MGIPGSRISSSATPQFMYGGLEYDGSKITVSDSDSSNSSFLVIIVIIVILGMAGFAYFFIEFEDDSVPDNNYNKKERPDERESKFVKDDDHPGWLWDTKKEEWVEEK